MQLLLIVGIIFAVGAVMFALQNKLVVTVTLALWSFESTLAVVLLLTLGIGVLIAGLVSTPGLLRAQWAAAKLRRQVAILEERNARLEKRLEEKSTAASAGEEASAALLSEPKPYVGLKALLTGQASRNSEA